MNKLLKAIRLADQAHNGQYDPAGKAYITHPIRVMHSAKSVEEKIVAVLHDTVEDTDTSLKMINDIFGKTISEAVDAISRRPEETVKAYYNRVKSNKLAYRVKILDIKDNLDEERLNLLNEDTQIRLKSFYTKALLSLTKGG